jgi:hypothetical protein
MREINEPAPPFFGAMRILAWQASPEFSVFFLKWCFTAAWF